MKEMVTITLDKEIISWLKQKSKQLHIKLSTLINQLLWSIKDGKSI